MVSSSSIIVYSEFTLLKNNSLRKKSSKNATLFVIAVIYVAFI